MSAQISLRPMRAEDLPAADKLFRLAFGTWFHFPDPMQFRGDAAMFEPRIHAYPDGGVVGERDGEMVTLGFASRWGSLGVLGPIAVHPSLWRQGVAQETMAATLDIFTRWQVPLVGLFTFPNSGTHIRLYNRFDFWPRHLTPAMGKKLDPAAGGPAPALGSKEDRANLLARCREMTDALHAGLDLSREIAAVLDRGIGDVVLIDDGFAICHTGAGSEAGTKSCYVKFGMVKSGAGAAQLFERLVVACEAFAASRGVGELSAGMATGRHSAYRILIERGYRAQIIGIQLLRPWRIGFDEPEHFVIDDWR